MGFRVLVIDDSLTIRMGLRDVLGTSGFDVRLAASSEEATEVLSYTHVDLVILDVHLGEGTSTPLLRALVTNQFGRSIPVLVVSGSEGLGARLDALRDGAADFVAKPYDDRFVSKRAKDLTAGPAAPAPPYRVLVVDDSLTYGHAVAQELLKDGHDVVLATSAREATRYLELQRPDVALLDVFLPDTDGIELAKRIRAAEATRELPILLLTGRESTVVRQRATEANVTDFLAKSTPLSELRAWVAGAPGRPERAPSPRAPQPAAPARLAEPARPAGPARRAAPDGPAVAAPPADGSALFQEVVRVSGLSVVLGRSTLTLALRRAGTEPDTLTPASLSRSLEHIERMLTTFLPAADVRSRISAITALAKEEAPSK